MRTHHPHPSTPLSRAGVALYLFGAFVAFAPASASADTFVSVGEGWHRYSNDQFGTEFEFPANVFQIGPTSEKAELRQFLSQDATLEIFATENVWGESAEALRQGVLEREEGEVTYAPSGRNWFVLSGFRGDQIFYEKYLLRDGVLHAFGIEFPASAKPTYAPIIERIEDSFRVGTPASAAILKGKPPKLPKARTTADDPLVIY